MQLVMTDTNNYNGRTPTHSQGSIALDSNQKQAIALPQSICTDYALQGRPATPRGLMPLNAPPLAQYINAQGYCFAWGHILERRCDNHIDWDFCLEALLERYHQQHLLLVDLQQAAFKVLETTLPGLVGYEREPAAAYRQGWRLYQGDVISTFTLRCHFSREAEARDWLSTIFLPLLLPGLLYQVQEAIG
jgi:hypothetical protein